MKALKKLVKFLKGDRKKVKSLDLKPGDLQIFKGRFFNAPSNKKLKGKYPDILLYRVM